MEIGKGGIARMKLRLKDIADRVHVSTATVSNALNGNVGVSQSVRDKIFAAAKDMGYIPPKPRKDAQPFVRLVLYKSNGMVVMDTLFFSELIEAIQSECQRVGLELLISHVNKHKDPGYEKQVKAYVNEKCAGIILLATEMNEEELAPFYACQSPLVVLDNLFRGEKVHSVVMDNDEAGYTGTGALIEAGHTHIGCICSSVPFNNMKGRVQGMRACLREHGLDDRADLWLVRPNITGAYEDMKQLIAGAERMPTAFFACNDLMAIGSMRALQEAGYSVPGDISIVGMDDTAVCLACTPALTTVKVFRREMGVAVIRTLLQMAEDIRACALKLQVEVELVRRDSVRNIKP